MKVLQDIVPERPVDREVRIHRSIIAEGGPGRVIDDGHDETSRINYLSHGDEKKVKFKARSSLFYLLVTICYVETVLWDFCSTPLKKG